MESRRLPLLNRMVDEPSLIVESLSKVRNFSAAHHVGTDVVLWCCGTEWRKKYVSAGQRECVFFDDSSPTASAYYYTVLFCTPSSLVRAWFVGGRTAETNV